ncbi:IS110 family transposase [Planktothrix sp. FACHB-1355]|uniref:IS110 family transposase n=1 Tax=Planktothrix sp. FACHB-1355 TaxID=2692854 RepID=UPI00168BA7C0|nr:IS110 family transposase [Planktothrix sp. FACHB-1355]MBD3557535.1 IS110 family transposase [Planktothrix sp. FACHB-1355]
MTLYIGVDFHPYQQTLVWCDTETGETETHTLSHEVEQVRAFYEQLKPAIVGVEASSKALWFEHLLAQTNHQLEVGNPLLIRRRATSRHKSDRRDAELILDLLMKGEFPSIWRRSPENTEVLEILKLRDSLVRQQTQTLNRLKALATNVGLLKGRMKADYFQAQFKELAVDEVTGLQRSQLLKMVESFNERIGQLESWLRQKAENDERVQLLLTQPGVGYLTALAVVNSIGEMTRFTHPTKQVPAYLGLEPLERESAGKRKSASISRAGNSITRYLLGQAGHLSARSDEKLKAFYKRMAKKKARGVAKMATARKLLVKLVIMWRDQISAAEFDERGGTVNNARRTQGLKDPQPD